MAGLFNRKKSDPMWDHFINRPPADPDSDLVAALGRGGEGRVFPVKSNEPDPVVMSQNLKHLARWWGADLVGIVPLPPGHDQVVTPSGDAEPEDAPSDAQPDSGPTPRLPIGSWWSVRCFPSMTPKLLKGRAVNSCGSEARSSSSTWAHSSGRLDSGPPRPHSIPYPWQNQLAWARWTGRESSKWRESAATFT